MFRLWAQQHRCHLRRRRAATETAVGAVARLRAATAEAAAGVAVRVGRGGAVPVRASGSVRPNLGGEQRTRSRRWAKCIGAKWQV